ncbi:MAG: hypothetical protein KDK70_31930, partial [Myxococcales bacterium]|nr:hypothetical protein [Myxococcales bacterium]
MSRSLRSLRSSRSALAARARRLGPWALVLGLLPGCDPEPTDERIDLQARALVGTVDDTDLALGVLLDGDALAIYQCGGPQRFDSHTRWFRGVVGAGDDPNAFELVSDGFTLTGIRTADGLEGELVEPDGSRHPFAVDPVADDAQAGVYVAEQDGRTTGVVVREDGGLTAQGASCTTSAPVRCDQVIILAPLAIQSDTIDVQVDVDGT